MLSDNSCPCGSLRPYSSCCESFLLGTAIAPTAEALMRSRYTAYATHIPPFQLAHRN
ncbi:MAG: hypothetical protein F6K09_04910 [Merismopedia sp. SIO2A8]|nr:hypothetical protein [Merismopedia sp. SIO2A8]